MFFTVDGSQNPTAPVEVGVSFIHFQVVIPGKNEPSMMLVWIFVFLRPLKVPKDRHDDLDSTFLGVKIRVL